MSTEQQHVSRTGGARRAARTLLVALAAALTVAACGKGGDDASSGPEGVKTGPGVTADTITVGILADLSGPFAASVKPQVQTMRLYWQERNKAGGVCDRKVEIQVQDHGYDPQKAVSLYRSMAPNIAALMQIQGSPIVAALLSTLEQDHMFLGGAGWASVILPARVSAMPGTSYSIQGANGVDFLVQEKGLSSGDSIGYIYFEGDYGEDALAGAEFAAKRHGLKIVKRQVTPADTDMTSAASSFRRAGVKAMMVATAPTQLASLAAVARSSGLDAPIVATMPSWNGSLLKTNAAKALQQEVYSLNPVAPYAADAAPATKARELYSQAQPKGVEDFGTPLGWGQALLMDETLKAACERKDLSREGIVEALRSLSNVDSQGLFPKPLSFTKVGEPPTRAIYLTKVDGDAPGGLEIVKTMESESAKAYTFSEG